VPVAGWGIFIASVIFLCFVGQKASSYQLSVEKPGTDETIPAVMPKHKLAMDQCHFAMCKKNGQVPIPTQHSLFLISIYILNRILDFFCLQRCGIFIALKSAV